MNEKIAIETTYHIVHEIASTLYEENIIGVNTFRAITNKEMIAEQFKTNYRYIELINK